MEKRLCAKVNLSCAKFTGGAIRTFSLMAMAGVLSMSAQAFSMDIDEAMKNKPVDTPTLEYLKTNEVLIPQKDADAIQSPGSMFSITDANAESFSFEYKTTDANGNITPSYYNINLNSKAEPSSLSSHVIWTKGNPDNPNDIAVEQHDGSFKYYHYEYASDYELAPERINNTLTSDNAYHKLFTGLSSSVGSAIYNTKTDVVSDIISDFINNRAAGGTSAYSGGIIFNYANTANTVHLGKIEGVFADNIVNKSGVIFNVVRSGTSSTAIIDSISGDFINNSSASSGAILNRVSNDVNGTAIIGSIGGNFINNKGTEYYGGAIWNDAHINGTVKIGSISGNFINNYANVAGGAIMNGRNSYNASITIDNIKGSFINNIAGKSGGAIYNDRYAVIGTITGDFVSNKATNEKGGAIYNLGKINLIVGDFINNEAGDSGGAISHIFGDIGSIAGNFINNTAGIDAGAINTGAGTIGDITGMFIHNVAETGSGGVFWHGSGIIGNITAHFIDNSAGASGGVLCNEDAIVGNIVGDFINNSAGVNGGAIYNITYDTGVSSVGNIKGHFVANSASENGGAIYNKAQGTAVAEIGNIDGNFIDNKAVSSGGAIYNEAGTIGIKDAAGKVIGGIINSSFIGNYAKSESGTAKGGAIYQSSSIPLNLISQDDYISVIKDNYTESKGVRDDNAIYLSNSTLNFQMKNGGKFYVADNIDGDATKANTVNITGDSIDNTMFYMLNDIRNSAVNVGATTLNTINNDIHTYNFKSLTLTDNVNMVADVDLANQTMDRFTAESYGNHGNNKLSVIGMNIVKDAPSSSAPLAIYFAEPGLKNNVSNGDINLPSEKWQTKAYTPLYQYTVTYDNEYATEENGLQDGGYFVFTQGGSLSGNPSDNFNPAVLATSVNTQAASQATVNETFKYVFEHADAFTQMPSFERQAIINADRYALSTDFNHNLGSLCPEHNNKAGWFRPYVTFENMSLRNGPKVDAITYGSLVGFDSDFQHFKHGWTGVTTGYVGYNGSQLSYGGVDTSMNGGILGVTQTLYKGNFWSALTLSAGASVGESNTMYGKEDFTSLLAGVGSKTGYNFEFKEGKYIIQPIMFLSYTFVNTFDYTNAAGVKINASPAHSILLNPSIRFITNTKNGWQPYASVGMVWNVMNENKVIANNVRLPEMSMKPYVEYGLGIQKNWKDNFTAFGQAMLRNGGRNGIAFTAGMRWAIGHKHPEKVNKPQPKVIKQAKI